MSINKIKMSKQDEESLEEILEGLPIQKEKQKIGIKEGTINWWKDSKGYGFIKQNDGADA